VAAAAVTAIVAGWAWGQYPYLLPTTLSLRAGSAPTDALLAIMAVVGLTALLVIPGFVLLFWLQQRDALEETPTEQGLREAVRTRELATAAGGRQASSAQADGHHRVVAAIVVTSVVAGAVHDTLANARARRRAKRGQG
jgi:hypothetical protein